jgi:hypothetical protein
MNTVFTVQNNHNQTQLLRKSNYSTKLNVSDKYYKKYTSINFDIYENVLEITTKKLKF